MLTGIKHCGKTTLGSLLAAQLDLPFFDTDALIFEKTGTYARELYSAHGEKTFMDAETEAAMSIAASGVRAVVASGGGICKNERAFSALKACGKFVYIKIAEKTAFERIFAEAKWDASAEKFTNLPAYIQKENPKTREEVASIFHTFFEERSALY